MAKTKATKRPSPMAATRGSRAFATAITQVRYVEPSALVAALLEHDTSVVKHVVALD